MRIAQIAPLHEPVPPKLYGGTERVVSYLTEELVAMGHEVTLFASADSRTRARLEPQCEALRLDPRCEDPIPEHLAMIDQVLRTAHRFDVIHFHLDYLHLQVARCAKLRHVTTLHGRLDLPHQARMFRACRGLPFVSISSSQREPVRWLDWQATIHHGLPADLYAPRSSYGAYLAFLGRMSPEKGVDAAIEIAKRAEVPLRIAAKIGRDDKAYYEEHLRPRMRHPLVEYLGEVTEAEKRELLGGALALLFPIDWPEPFGLVLIEAMACGTPVIAYRRGAVPEVVRDGVTGFVVDTLEQAVHAVELARKLDRRRCREAFERHFTAARMARDHVLLYDQLLEARERQRPSARPFF